jgi:hypothetical protein
MDELRDITSFDKEWKQTKKILKKKLKFRFWFFQNISGIALVCLLFMYWLIQTPQFGLFAYRVHYLLKWLLTFIEH